MPSDRGTLPRSLAGSDDQHAIWPEATAPSGRRLPSAPRERKPALAALAVLLILAGALGATVLVTRAGNRVGVVEITAGRIAAGQNINASQIAEVMVADDSSVQYVLWSQRGDLVQKYRTAVPVVQGTLLVGPMLTTAPAATSGKLIVGTSLKAGQYPPGLTQGDTVEVLRVGSPDSSANGSGSGSGTTQSANNASTLPGTILSQTATVESASGDSSGNMSVSLMVNQSDAPALAQAASAGNVALVLVPSAG